MCGRYNLRATPQEIQEFFDLFRTPDWTPRYNIAPTQRVLALRFDESATPREPVLLRWGLIPAWAKDEKIGASLINARVETVAEKPSFRTPFRRRRCLIPATGFFEWQAATAGPKQPFHIHRTNHALFAFAGVWERWGKGEQAVESCTILTTAASAELRPLHDRMPVILRPEDYDPWLAPSGYTVEELLALVRRSSLADLTADPVSTLVNNPRHESPDCVQVLPAGP
jgi:putative SOS response-associated peptidase YedK